MNEKREWAQYEPAMSARCTGTNASGSGRCTRTHTRQTPHGVLCRICYRKIEGEKIDLEELGPPDFICRR